jgi:hypothetical protein
MADTRAAAGGGRVEDLEAERDRLRQRVVELEARPGRRRRTRRVFAALFTALAILAFAAVVPAAWARRTLLETDRYVEVVAPLPEDPAIREYLSRTITDAVFEALSVEERVGDALAERAPRLAFFAGPLTNGVRGFVRDRVHGIVSSEAFATYWTEVNRFVHEQIVLALEGQSSLVTTDGRVVLNLLPMVNEALRRISGIVSELIGRDLRLPEVTSEEVPAKVIPRLEAALGVDLPDRFGTIVVYDGNEVATMQRAVDALGRWVVLVALGFLVLAGVALRLSRSKRRTLVQLLAAAVVVLVLERRFAITAADRIVGEAREENREAARVVVDQVLGTLLGYTGWLALIALLVLSIALVTGPYRWAVRLRTWARDVGTAAVGNATEGPSPGVGVWISVHRDASMLIGAALAVSVFFVANLSFAGAIVLTLVFAAFELLVLRIAAGVHGRQTAGARPA